MSEAALLYSRANPSARYRELVALYNKMHLEGDPRLNAAPEKMFPGTALKPHIPRIRHLIQATGARTLLDYGAGKGIVYRTTPWKAPEGEFKSVKEYFGLDVLRLYDPAYPPHSELPSGKYDGVVCTDVLEHCPEEDIPWILDEIFGYARMFVYANVACYAALKTLPNGENAHCTIRPSEWWEQQLLEISRRHPGVAFYMLLETQTELPDGTRKSAARLIIGRDGRLKTPASQPAAEE